MGEPLFVQGDVINVVQLLVELTQIESSLVCEPNLMLERQS
jgi:hypothetical protein